MLQDNTYSNRFGLDARPRVTFKTEEDPIVALMKAQKDMAAELANMTKVFLQSTNSNQSQGYSAQNNQNNLNSQFIPVSCAFCGEHGHKVRTCPKAKQMISEGKCVINSENHIVMPDGKWLSPPGLLKDRIKRQHTLNNQEWDTPPHMRTQTLMFMCDTVDTLFNTGSGLEEVGEEEVCDVLQLNMRSTNSKKPGPGQNSETFKSVKKVPEVVIS